MSGETEQALDTVQTDAITDQQDIASAEAETAVGELEGGEQQQQDQVTEAQVEPENDPRFAKQFAALSRKERELRQRQAELKQAEEQREAIAAFDKAMRENPLKALQDYYGYDTDKLVTALVRNDHEKPDPNLTRLEQIEARIREFDEASERHRQQQVEAQKKKQVEEYVAQIRSMIDDEPSDKFELIKATEEYDLVNQFIIEHWEQHQRPLAPEKAAALAEDYLMKKAEKALQARKLQAKKEAATKPKQAQSQTLTNDMRNAPQGNSTVAETEEEKKARFAALLRWT